MKSPFHDKEACIESALNIHDQLACAENDVTVRDIKNLHRD